MEQICILFYNHLKKKISTGLALQTFTTNNHQQFKTQVN